MKRSPRARERGLSLVELVLGLAIAATIMVPLLSTLTTMNAAAAITGDRFDLERDADFALERISTRIRATAPALLPPQSNSTTSGNWLSPVSYALSGTTLVERQNGVDQVLAESVSAFSITAPAVDAGQPVVVVSLTLARGDATVSSNATVRMGGPR